MCESVHKLAVICNNSCSFRNPSQFWYNKTFFQKKNKINKSHKKMYMSENYNSQIYNLKKKKNPASWENL